MHRQDSERREKWLDMSMSVTGRLISRWLDGVSDLIEVALPPCSKIYAIIGGSLLSDLATTGSDLDLCMLVDDRGSAVCMRRLDPSFRRTMKELDERLREFGLHLCRLSRRIHMVSGFLQLERCPESRAARVRATVKMHYLLSSRQVILQCEKQTVQCRLGSEREFFQLKHSLWEDYKRSLDCTQFLWLSSLLRRPGSYSPGRVLRQANVLVDNILLSSCRSKPLEAIKFLSRPLEEKLRFIVRSRAVAFDELEQRLVADNLKEGVRLMRSAKEISMVQRSAYRKSFHYLKVHGYISSLEWRRIEETTRYLYEMWQFIQA